MQILLDLGTPRDEVSPVSDKTALMEACEAGHANVALLLLDSGADVNRVAPRSKQTALHSCVLARSVPLLQLLVARGAGLEAVDSNGHTPLMLAAVNDALEVARVLIELVPNVDFVGNEYRDTALTLAAYRGHAAICELLLESGANLEHRTSENHTPLMEAALEGHSAVIELLANRGARLSHSQTAAGAAGRPAGVVSSASANPTPTVSPNVKPANQKSPAKHVNSHKSAHKRPHESLVCLDTALTLAASGGHIGAVRALLARNAPLEDFSLEGFTSLMEAARYGHNEVVRALLHAGANADALAVPSQAPEGGTPAEVGGGESAVQLAARAGHLGVVQLLVREGRADPDAGSVSPLAEAAHKGHLEVVRFLLREGMPNRLHKIRSIS